MTFNSIDALKSYILSRSKVAIQKAEEQVYQILDRFMKEYYAEFSPEVYERTYQLYRSLVKSEIIPTGDGYKACVYFDATNLDYQIKHLTRYPVDGGYMNPYNGAISSDGTFQNPKGSAELTLESAMHGSHGGYTNGTAVWDEGIAVLNAEMYNILKRMLRDSGIPVK